VAAVAGAELVLAPRSIAAAPEIGPLQRYATALNQKLRT
jgi:hypothetical protein